MKQERTVGEQRSNARKSKGKEQVEQRSTDHEMDEPGLVGLQHLVGNRAVQHLLAQRSGVGSTSASLNAGFELDDDTAGRINRQRGGGQPLDTALQKQASEAMGHDLSGVRVHTSPEASDLSGQLSAKAFTTGRDIFFQEGAYDPHSSGGRELIAHELTHVVQQSSGAVTGGPKMTVNPPGDGYEREADQVAREAKQQEMVHRQVEEEETIQAKASSASRLQEDGLVQRSCNPRRTLKTAFIVGQVIDANSGRGLPNILVSVRSMYTASGPGQYCTRESFNSTNIWTMTSSSGAFVLPFRIEDTAVQAWGGGTFTLNAFIGPPHAQRTQQFRGNFQPTTNIMGVLGTAGLTNTQARSSIAGILQALAGTRIPAMGPSAAMYDVCGAVLIPIQM
jgi:hypothetical protein